MVEKLPIATDGIRPVSYTHLKVYGYKTTDSDTSKSAVVSAEDSSDTISEDVRQEDRIKQKSTGNMSILTMSVIKLFRINFILRFSM